MVPRSPREVDRPPYREWRAGADRECEERLGVPMDDLWKDPEHRRRAERTMRQYWRGGSPPCSFIEEFLVGGDRESGDDGFDPRYEI